MSISAVGCCRVVARCFKFIVVICGSNIVVVVVVKTVVDAVVDVGDAVGVDGIIIVDVVVEGIIIVDVVVDDDVIVVVKQLHGVVVVHFENNVIQCL